MAEIYGIYDWRALPLATAATLAQGLPASSRVAKRISNVAADRQEILLAIIADRIGHVAWMLSQDGQDGKNHPPSIFAALTGTDRAPDGFESGEDFEAAWTVITGGETDA